MSPIARLRSLLPLALAACAAPAPVSTGPAEPAGIALELRLSQDPLAVDLALAFPGDDDGETVIEVTEAWGGVGPDRRDLEDVRVEGEAGAPLALEVLGPHRWRARHAPGEPLVVRAHLPQNPESLRTDLRRRVHYRPMLEPGLLHAVGHLLLPVPDHLEWTRPRALALAYPGFEEAGWTVVDSFGTGAGPRRARASLGDLRHALFVAGDLDLLRPEAAPGLVVAVARPGFDFAPEELADAAARILSLERELMGDPGGRHYLVSAIAVGERSERGFSFGGTGLSNAFALFLQPGARLALDSDSGLAVRRLLAHEGFHEWNGVRIPLAQPEEPCYWFSEGFTDFFARRVLRLAGWLDDEAYARDLSERLAAYHTSPARNRTAAELGPAFWTDSDAERQPYLRGDVVACLLDRELLRASGGERDLARFMRDRLREAEEQGIQFDAELLLARIAAEAGDGVAARVRAVVVDGATAELPPDAFGPGFELGERTVHAFDPGFDVDGSIERRAALGVRPGGPAALAGLLEGQEIRGFSIYRGDPDREVELAIVADGAERQLSYLPRGAAVVVPEVRARAGGGGGARYRAAAEAPTIRNPRGRAGAGLPSDPRPR